MIKLRPEQMEKLEADYRKRRRKALWDKFKDTYPELCKDVADEQGIEIISGCVDDGKALDITDDEDILRFSALAFLPKDIRHDDWVCSMIIRILHKENISAEERLSFIFDNVIDSQCIS